MSVETIIKDYWSQVVLILGLIGYIIQTLTSFYIKKKEINFSKLQEHKISEVKIFFRSYQQLEVSLKDYLHQTKFGEHSPEIFQKIRVNIYERFQEFNYNLITVKLFLSDADIKTVDEIYKTLETIRIDIGSWHIYVNSESKPDNWNQLRDIMNNRFPNKLPSLISKIESSLRESLNSK